MRYPIVAVIILLVFSGAIDYYIYRVVRKRCGNKRWSLIYAISAIVLLCVLIATIILPKRGGSNTALECVIWLLFGYLSIYIPKVLFLIFDLLAKIPTLMNRQRLRILSYAGIGLGVVVFVSMWWGALFNRYNIDVVDEEVEISELPAGFNGFTIVQISDLHVGTFGTDDSYIKKFVKEVNGLHPDLIVFTGDIVNRKSEELKPFADALSQLKAPYGVYSILGNHDYGDYSSWRSDAEKAQDVQNLCKMQESMGWKMLNNATAWIKKGNDSIALIGVENVGDPPFKTYGDLQKAYPNLHDANVKILLTHNPAHWISEIENNIDNNIALTLSGHTHAMQITMAGWSPAAWRYRTWGGMYADNSGKKLYVNIGAGEVGFPARIGATPEITLFTLKTE